MKSKYNKQIADSLTLIKLKLEETSKDDLPEKNSYEERETFCSNVVTVLIDPWLISILGDKLVNIALTV
jgi:hypothetical protein